MVFWSVTEWVFLAWCDRYCLSHREPVVGRRSVARSATELVHMVRPTQYDAGGFRSNMLADEQRASVRAARMKRSTLRHLESFSASSTSILVTLSSADPHDFVKPPTMIHGSG